MPQKFRSFTEAMPRARLTEADVSAFVAAMKPALQQIAESIAPPAPPEPTAEQLAGMRMDQFDDIKGGLWANRFTAAEASPGGQALQAAQAHANAFWAPAITAAQQQEG